MHGQFRAPRFDWRLARETIPALIVGALGLVLAGVVLEVVEGWRVMVVHPTLLVLMPMLMGLKCNLEMTLASRLGTAFHTGALDASQAASNSRVFIANMGVVQVQGVIVALASGVIGYFYATLFGEGASFRSFLIMVVTSLMTAWIDAVILGLMTGLILYISHRYGMDPDNLLGPLVASLGDLLAIVVLGCSAHIADALPSWVLALTLLAMVAVVLPLARRMAYQDAATASVLRNGWTPFFHALCISSVAGFFLEGGTDTLQKAGVVVLCPLLNGLGGNLSGIFGSRQASALHKRGTRDPPFTTEFTLLGITVPLHLLFLIPIGIITQRTSIFSITFLSVYLVGALAQVVVLLMTADVLVNFAWSRDLDPDNYVSPYLTSLGDALGTTVLVVSASMALHA